MFKGRLVSTLVLVLTLVICLAASAGISRAEAPQWSGGFPKIVQDDVLLQWNPVKGATEYKIYKSEQKDKGLKLLATVKANRHIDKGIGAGKTFYYYIAPVVGGKEGERSSAGFVTIAKAKVFVPLKTPKLVGAHLKELPGGKYSVGVRWEDAGGTDFVGVNVYRSKVKGKDYAMIGSSSSDSFEDTDIQQGETYYYVITSVDNQFKETKYSNEINVKIPAPVTAAVAKVEEEKSVTTKMRPAKFLFTIPRDPKKGDQAILPQLAMDVAVDEAVGHVYVTSQTYGGVLVYDMQGNFQFGIRRDGVNGKDKFGVAMCVTVGDNGNIYVSDYAGPSVSVFDFAGKPVGTITVDISHMSRWKGVVGIGPKNQGVALAKDGTIYIDDPGVNSIHVYNRDRKHLYDITGGRNEEEMKKYKEKLVFNGPGFSVVTKEGDLAFIDSGYARILVLGEGGKLKKTIGKYGFGAGDLYFPTGLALGTEGELLVGAQTSPNIQAFSTSGKFLYALCNEKGDGPIQIGSSQGLFVDSHNRLYVAEGLAGRVSVFQLLEGTLNVLPK